MGIAARQPEVLQSLIAEPGKLSPLTTDGQTKFQNRPRLREPPDNARRDITSADRLVDKLTTVPADKQLIHRPFPLLV